MTGSIQPGPQNALTDVAGLRVGNAEDPVRPTGVTVILPDAPVNAAVDIRGGGPGTRETDVLNPASTVEEIHGLALSGGSAFGLDAAGGVMDWLRRQGRGFAVGETRVPIVPAAIIYDLGLPGATGWEAPPWWQLGVEAAASAGTEIALGNRGAGAGATAGPVKGGLGTASFTWQGLTIAALVIANPIGSATLPGMAQFWAWPFEQGAEFGGLPPPPSHPRELGAALDRPPGAATSLVVLATDAKLSQSQLQRLAIMGHDGLARAIRPIHSSLDGDTVFALSTARADQPDTPGDLTTLGMLGADCVARAVARAVFEAESIEGCPSWRDIWEGKDL